MFFQSMTLRDRDVLYLSVFYQKLVYCAKQVCCLSTLHFGAEPVIVDLCTLITKVEDNSFGQNFLQTSSRISLILEIES